MNYKYIIEPLSRQSVPVSSAEGRRLLKLYVNALSNPHFQSGGTPENFPNGTIVRLQSSDKSQSTVFYTDNNNKLQEVQQGNLYEVLEENKVMQPFNSPQYNIISLNTPSITFAKVNKDDLIKRGKPIQKGMQVWVRNYNGKFNKVNAGNNKIHNGTKLTVETDWETNQNVHKDGERLYDLKDPKNHTLYQAVKEKHLVPLTNESVQSVDVPDILPYPLLADNVRSKENMLVYAVEDSQGREEDGSLNYEMGQVAMVLGPKACDKYICLDVDFGSKGHIQGLYIVNATKFKPLTKSMKIKHIVNKKDYVVADIWDNVIQLEHSSSHKKSNLSNQRFIEEKYKIIEDSVGSSSPSPSPAIVTIPTISSSHVYTVRSGLVGTKNKNGEYLFRENQKTELTTFSKKQIMCRPVAQNFVVKAFRGTHKNKNKTGKIKSISDEDSEITVQFENDQQPTKVSCYDLKVLENNRFDNTPLSTPEKLRDGILNTLNKLKQIFKSEFFYSGNVQKGVEYYDIFYGDLGGVHVIGEAQPIYYVLEHRLAGSHYTLKNLTGVVAQYTQGIKESIQSLLQTIKENKRLTNKKSTVKRTRYVQMIKEVCRLISLSSTRLKTYLKDRVNEYDCLQAKFENDTKVVIKEDAYLGTSPYVILYPITSLTKVKTEDENAIQEYAIKLSDKSPVSRWKEHMLRFYEEPYYKVNDIVTVQEVSEKHDGLLHSLQRPTNGGKWIIKSIESKSSISSEEHTYNLVSTIGNEKLDGVVQCRLCYDLETGMRVSVRNKESHVHSHVRTNDIKIEIPNDTLATIQNIGMSRQNSGKTNGEKLVTLSYKNEQQEQVEVKGVKQKHLRCVQS